MKRVYTFGDGKAEGNAEMRNLLGGKGANLAEMNLLGMPVPPGFTITTEVCNEYTLKGRDAVVALIQKDVEAAIAHFNFFYYRINFFLSLPDGPGNPIHFTNLIQNRSADSQACIRFKFYFLEHIKFVDGINQSKDSVADHIVKLYGIPKIHA